MNNPTTLSAEELDAAFTAFTTAAPRIHHLRAVRAHIEALTSRAEKAEGEVASFKRALEIEKGNTASAHDDYADLKREADRMRGALEDALPSLQQAMSIIRTHVPKDALGVNAQGDPDVPGGYQSWPLLDEYLHYMSEAEAKARAALSHQADDAGAVTGSEERLREALRPFERFAEYLAGRPGVTLAGATVREETIMPDDEIATVGDASGFATIRARHFLDAAAALSEQQGGK